MGEHEAARRVEVVRLAELDREVVLLFDREHRNRVGGLDVVIEAAEPGREQELGLTRGQCSRGHMRTYLPGTRDISTRGVRVLTTQLVPLEIGGNPRRARARGVSGPSPQTPGSRLQTSKLRPRPARPFCASSRGGQPRGGFEASLNF